MNSDERLQRHVLEELDWEPSVDASKIGVTVSDAVVTLSGHVPVYAERVVAERVAKGVHGARQRGAPGRRGIYASQIRPLTYRVTATFATRRRGHGRELP